MKKIALHKVGIGGVYQSKDKRATAVQVTRWTSMPGHCFVYFKWVAKFGDKVLGEGSLAECRRLINEAARLDEEITWACT